MGDALMSRQIAIVTGAGSGIGRATAIALANDGYHVALIRRTEERVAQTLAAINRQGSVYVGDVTKSKDVTAIFNKISESNSQVAILVNNAGHLQQKMPPNHFHRGASSLTAFRLRYRDRLRHKAQCPELFPDQAGQRGKIRYRGGWLCNGSWRNCATHQ